MSSLKNKNVIVTAGPTHEAIDPVRFIGNHSSGKMGYAIAKSLVDKQASVTLISGPSNLTPPEGVKFISVTSALEMYEETLNAFQNCDAYILSAAVADYKPATIAKNKIKKKGDTLTLELIKTVDIAAELGKKKTPNQVAVGFALETTNEEKHALEKLVKKKFNFIVLNSLRNEGTCFGSDQNKISIITTYSKKDYPQKNKVAVANDIVSFLETYYEENIFA